jgi:N-acetylglucosaminyl-diphospho-decaprenol L-rhamnosyltransferase
LTALSIVVVTWNSAGELPALLESIAGHLPAAELVVVDNGSTDDTLQLAREWPGKTRVIELSSSTGFGAAANRGVQAATSDAVALLNPDARLVDDSLSAVAELALAERALVGPAFLNEDGSRQPSASPPPAGWEVGLEAVAPAALLPRQLRLRCEPWRSDERRDVGWLTGACLAAPRDLLLELGPFDETLDLFAEDMDLGLRARALGVRSIFAPDCGRIVHLGSRSAARRFEDDGTALKLGNRRAVVDRRLGRARERYDFAAQLAFHATRWAMKTLLRRDARAERRWLEAALPWS